MKRLFSIMMFLIAFICLSCVSADEHEDDYNPQNYLYDEEGEHSFIKVYIDKLDSKHIFHRLAQTDKRGSFLAIPLQKIHSKEKPDEWRCPYCGLDNPVSTNTCLNKECTLYRTKPRDW